jgi:hypothetical protein
MEGAWGCYGREGKITHPFGGETLGNVIAWDS